MRIRVSGAEVAVGAFVLIGILGFLGFYVASGGYLRLGREWVTVRGGFGNVTGLTVGAEVRMNGIDIGVVRRVALDDAGRVEMQISIERKYHVPFVRQSDAARQLAAAGRNPTEAELVALRSDGSSTLRVEGGLLTSGSGTVVISQGRPELSRVEPGDMVVGLPQSSIWDAVANLAKTVGDIAGRDTEQPGGSIAAVLQDQGRLYERTMAAISNADKTVDNLNVTVTALREDAQQGIDELNGTLREARELLASMNRRGFLGAMDGREGRSQAQVESLLASLEEILADLKEFSARLPELAAETSDLVDGGRNAMGEVEDLVGASKRHWLIKDLFEPAQDSWLRAYDLGPRTP